MTDLVGRLEERRLSLGLTQKEAGAAIGMSQPNYSRLVGGIVTVSESRVAAIEEWLRHEPGANLRLARSDERIRELARSIERQLRELNRLLSSGGVGGRLPRGRTGVRRD